MAFPHFWRDRERHGADRDRERSRSGNEWREAGRGGREQSGGYGSYGDDQDFNRRGWSQGSDYYGNRDQSYSARGYGDRDYGRQREQEYGRQGYGGQGYGEEYGGQGYRGGERSDASRERGFGGEYVDRAYTGSGYTSGNFGREYDYVGGSGGGDYGHDLDYGRRGAYGYGGYGGMGGAETGSSAYAESQFRGRGPRGYRRSDERIREDVCDCLTDDEQLDASNMEITVKDCEVTLSGTVSSREDKRRAEDLVEGISGVKDVHNTLRVAREQRAAQGTQESSSGGQTARH